MQDESVSHKRKEHINNELDQNELKKQKTIEEKRDQLVHHMNSFINLCVELGAPYEVVDMRVDGPLIANLKKENMELKIKNDKANIKIQDLEFNVKLMNEIYECTKDASIKQNQRKFNEIQAFKQEFYEKNAKRIAEKDLKIKELNEIISKLKK